MSNPRVDPHPDKWLSAPKVLKAATQRPLVSSSFRAHAGIATPPTTTRKGASNSAAAAPASTSRKRRAPEATPTAPHGLRSIQSYLTPPTSTTQPARKQRASSKLKNASHLHQSPTRRSPRLHRDRQERERSEALESWRASLPPPTRSPSKRAPDVASRSPSPGFEMLEAPATPEAAAPASGSAIIPLPSSAVAIHKRLRGQDSDRPKQDASPLRRGQEPEEDKPVARAERDVARQEAEAQRRAQRDAQRERKRIRLDAKDENAQSRVGDTKERRALGDFKSLAHLSSERSSSPRSSSPSGRVPLASKNANALRRHSSAVVRAVCPRDLKWPQRQPAQRTPGIPSAFPTRSQVVPSAFPSRLRTTPAESSQPSSSTRLPPPFTTPRARRIAHHHVTPPKSRTPQGRDLQQTLFEFPPAPPRQPVFKPLSPQPISDWRPVEMQAETLMTWSMGGGNVTSVGVVAPRSPSPVQDEVRLDNPPAPVDNDDEVLHETIPSQYFPNLVGTPSSPARPPQESYLLSSPPEPIEAFEPAEAPGGEWEAFPREPSSPSPRRSRPAAHPPSSPPRLSFGPASPMAKLPSKSPTKLVRHSKQDVEKRRRAMDHALFSSLSEISQVRPAPRVLTVPFPRPTQNRKTPPPPTGRSKTPPPRKSQKKRSASPSKSQSKLEAFGYSRLSAGDTREFDMSFSDEEDLDFGDVDKRASSPCAGPSELRLVPSAPPHPSLRPMGIREQAKRSDAAMERHRGQRESLRSGDRSSSLPPPPSAITDGSSSQSDDRLEAQVSESTRAWWEGLADDKSSE